MAKLREAEKLQGQGLTIGQLCKRLGITEQTFYRWRLTFGTMTEAEAARLKVLEQENTQFVEDRCESGVGYPDVEGFAAGKLVSPSRRRQAVAFLQRRHRVSERRACTLVSQHRSTNRHQPDRGVFERRLVKRLHELAEAHPQEGYKTIYRRLRFEGWRVNHKRVWRLWRREGLKQPEKQTSGKHAEGVAENAMWKRRAERPDHIWAYDFMSGHTTDGRSFRILNVIDEYTREVVSCTVERSIGATRVERALAEVFSRRRRKPEILRSDNGREFISARLVAWLGDEGVECAFIAKGRPNQNGIVERLNGLMRRHVLDVEDLNTLLEARVVISDWVNQYNHHRPHGAIGGTSPDQYHKQYLETQRRALTSTHH